MAMAIIIDLCLPVYSCIHVKMSSAGEVVIVWITKLNLVLPSAR
jgi:hypothetical protein